MNKFKRNCTLMLAIVLTLGVVLMPGIGRVFAEKAGIMKESGPNKYIYFDLAAGSITVTNTTYTGYVYVNGAATKVTGDHSTENKYYVYQSNGKNNTQTGYETEDDYDNKSNCRIPVYPRVKNGGTLWNDYITDNTDVYSVSTNWPAAAAASERTATQNYITFGSMSNYTVDMTVDSIWSDYRALGTSRTTGGIGAHLNNCKNTTIKINMKGDNRVGNVHYAALKGSTNEIIFENGEDEAQYPGSITVANPPNHWGGTTIGMP